MRRAREKGFTLVELMIVISIIGILAAVFVPFYKRYVMGRELATKIVAGQALSEEETRNRDLFKEYVDDLVAKMEKKER